jgi:hypothetical protein
MHRNNRLLSAMSQPDSRPQPVRLPRDWTPQSWRARTALQQPTYPDPVALESALSELGRLPPLVTSWEILALKQQLAEAQEGKRFLLQGGDCAESFSDCESGLISNRLKVLLQMSVVLVYGLRLPVVRVGRFAGQYAKPRSADTGNQGRRHLAELPRRHGQRNRSSPPRHGCPIRSRLIKAHARSAMTMNFVRSLIDGGFADLHHPEYWDLGWVSQSPHAVEYQKHGAGIGDAVRFMETWSGQAIHNLNRVDFYTSHEALLLITRRLDAPGAAPMGLVQPEHAFPVDRHAHRRAGWRAHRIHARHPQPGRREGWAVGEARPVAAPDRCAESGRRTRPPHPDPSHGCGATSRKPADRCWMR